MITWYKIAKTYNNWNDTATEYLLEKYAPELILIWKEKKNRFNLLMTQFADSMKDPSKSDMAEIPKEAILLDKEIAEMLRVPKSLADKQHEKTLNKQNAQKAQTEKRNENIYQLKDKLEKMARKKFPVTDNLRLAGFMMSNGDLLMMSYTGATRDIDHRYIREAFPEKMEIDDGTAGMWQFMSATGAIRINYSGGQFAAFDINTRVSYAQKEKLIDLIQKYRIREGVLNINHRATKFDEENYYKIIERL